MPIARATKAEITRAITAWKACGLVVGGLDVLPDGTIRIIAPVDKPRKTPQLTQELEPWGDD